MAVARPYVSTVMEDGYAYVFAATPDAAREIAGVVPPLDTIGAVPLTDATGADPAVIAVTRPYASVVIEAGYARAPAVPTVAKSRVAAPTADVLAVIRPAVPDTDLIISLPTGLDLAITAPLWIA
jgi:hypothetical protein